MKVTLIGAGPGDAELMTIKGMARLLTADVVLYDRLVSDDIIAMIPVTTEKICVGKHPNKHHVPQEDICHLMLEKVKQGCHVVRLKGGDPFVFGRGGEELEVLAAHGIPFEVVPGISSSIAVGGCAGIPLTHRDYASSLHIITGHAKKNGELDIDFEALVKLNGTIVILMGVATLEKICANFLAAGMPGGMPAAIVENVTHPNQRVLVGTVDTIFELAQKNAVTSPAVVIIGNVCHFAKTLQPTESSFY